MSSNENLNREQLFNNLQGKVSPLSVEIEHQKFMPKGGYRVLVDGVALGKRTTLSGINVQVDAFLVGWKLANKHK